MPSKSLRWGRWASRSRMASSHARRVFIGHGQHPLDQGGDGPGIRRLFLGSDREDAASGVVGGLIARRWCRNLFLRIGGGRRIPVWCFAEPIHDPGLPIRDDNHTLIIRWPASARKLEMRRPGWLASRPVRSGLAGDESSGRRSVSDRSCEMDKSPRRRHDDDRRIRAGPASSSREPGSASEEKPSMPSPFPGMDPYLEQEDAWHDFHERFIPLVATLLGGQLRPRYIVKIDEHVYVHELAAGSRRWWEGRCLPGTRHREATREPAPGRPRGCWRRRHRPAPRRGSRTAELCGDPRPAEPRAGHGRRAVEPGEQAGRARSGAIPGQAHGDPQRPGPPGRDRSPARRVADAGGRSAQVLLLGPGQPGRAPSRRRSSGRSRSGSDCR